MTYYKCGSIHPTQNSNVVVDTASGVIANFQTPLAIPLPKIRFDFKATQEAGTPTPQSPKAISGVSEVSAVHCHKNLYQYDESKVAIGTTTTATTRAYYPLGFKGVTSLTFSASLKSGSSTTASDYLNIGILRKSDGLLEILSAFITPAGITTRTLAISSDDEVVLMSLENPTVIKSILSRYDIQIEVGSEATSFEETQINATLINLGGTYYGGYVTQDKDGKRELVVTHKMLEWSNLNFRRSNNSGNWANYLFFASVSDMKYNYLQKSDIYEIQSVGNVGDIEKYKFRTSFSGAVPYVYFRNDDYVDVDAFVMAMNDHQFLYEITEPFTVALPDGEPIKSFWGTNNIYADTGDTSLQFRKIG